MQGVTWVHFVISRRLTPAGAGYNTRYNPCYETGYRNGNKKEVGPAPGYRAEMSDRRVTRPASFPLFVIGTVLIFFATIRSTRS